MSNPLIGITTNRNKNKFGFPQHSINQAYITALVGAGAAPVMIPLGLDKKRLNQLLDRLDGIVFSGGGDINPKRYYSQMHSAVNYVDDDRDRVELHLLQSTLQRRLPFLGICRGLQVINVGLGGTLFEDILDQRPNSLQHFCFPQHQRDYLAHAVNLKPDSRLNAILRCTQTEVNSLHHQGIDCIAPGMDATAHAPDGLIEAIEIPSYPFGLAVQWHPEHLQSHAPMRALFNAFVKACHTSNQEL